MGFEIDTCWSDPDVLSIPGGGRGAFEALQDDSLLDAIARIGSRATWVTSVCTGALLLGAAGLLKGYRTSCYWYARAHVSAFGAIPETLASSSTATARAAAGSPREATSRWR
jgi:cyclohexyl-isocyanide hydratase